MNEGFFRLHSDLPREGPGEPADVRWALQVAGVDPGACILDAGCGPGGDVATLLELPGARITAVDAHLPFVEAVRRRFPEVTASAGDMTATEGPFDFIWCAGALYFLGVSAGLAAFRGRLADGGAIAFSEPCLFSDDASDEARAFWEGYPARPLASLLHEVEAAGYSVLGTRRLSDAAWAAYYDPLLARAAALRPHADPDLARAIVMAEAEAALWDRVKDETGYLLVVARPE
jgi:trans-aconitate methyltransferase